VYTKSSTVCLDLQGQRSHTYTGTAAGKIVGVENPLLEYSYMLDFSPIAHFQARQVLTFLNASF
jgi:hypothetical protein